MYFNCEICGKRIDFRRNEYCQHYKNAVYTSDDKYKTLNDNGKLYVFRNGERWLNKEQDLIGDGYVLSLVQKIEELQEMLNNNNNSLSVKP